MNLSVVDVIQGKLIATKSHIALVIEPYFGRIEILDENPLPDVKFFALNKKGMFYIFLNNKLDIST